MPEKARVLGPVESWLHKELIEDIRRICRVPVNVTKEERARSRDLKFCC
ncbi:MAG: hypothetical protein ABR962_01050 [Candidatus Bathyarchaeia archaeon]|jgi:hypothetical protein